MSLTKESSSETLKEMDKPEKVENEPTVEAAEPEAPKEASEAKVEVREVNGGDGSVKIVESAVNEPSEASEEAKDGIAAQSTETPEKEAENGKPAAEAKPVAKESNGGSESAEEELLEIARKLYNEEFVSIRPEEYTQFLAADDADSETIRELYMDLFDWSPNLLRSTRTLCSKLYLKGESQEIDRILSAFTRSYISQNPVNVFGTRDFEKIYIILYSLILLNTALHNSEINKKSAISQSDYVRNTFTTFIHSNGKGSKLSVRQKIQIERELHSYYDDLSRNELYLKTNDSSSALNLRYRSLAPHSNRLSVADTIRSAVSGNSDNPPASPHVGGDTSSQNDLTRQISNSSNWSEQDRRQSLAISKVRSGSSAISHATATSTNAGYGMNSSARVGFTRVLHSDSHAQKQRNRGGFDHLRHYGHNSLAHKTSKSSIISRQSNTYGDQLSISTSEYPNLDQSRSRGIELENFDVADFQDSYDLELELQGSPYLKEGLLKLKIINNDSSDSAGHGESHSDNQSGLFSSSASVSSRRSGFFSFFKSAPKEPKPVSATVGTHSLLSSRFTDYFVVVSKGELRLYSFDPKNLKKQSQKLKKLRKHSLAYGVEFEDENDDVGDGNWLKNAANMGNYNLCSTVAQLERSSLSHSSDTIQWSLVFPKTSKKPSKKFVFEAGTVEIATEFVNACNFWASKITAVPPIEESVTSLEYGWTNIDGLFAMGEAFRKTKISKWEQLPKGIYISNLSTADDGNDASHEGFSKQFLMTVRYYNSLKSYYNNFSQRRTTFLRTMRKFSNSSNFKLVSQNYEARANEYKAELTKYKSYVIMLAYGLKLRFDAVENDVYEEIKQNVLDDPELSIDKENAVEVGAEVAKRLTDHHLSESEVVKLAKKELEKISMLTADLYMLFRKKDALPESRGEPLDFELPSELDVEEDTSGTLVKSPKNFSLADIKDENSPISQLLSVDVKGANVIHTEEDLTKAKRELIMSFSTSTIKEEDEELENMA